MTRRKRIREFGEDTRKKSVKRRLQLTRSRSGEPRRKLDVQTRSAAPWKTGAALEQRLSERRKLATSLKK